MTLQRFQVLFGGLSPQSRFVLAQRSAKKVVRGKATDAYFAGFAGAR